MNRQQAIALMMRLEGGYVNNSKDPGGATNGGITQRTLDSLQAVPFTITLPTDVKNLTQDEIAIIYQSVQWRAIAGDALPPVLAMMMLNSAVNQGEPTAIKLLHDVLGIEGTIVGPTTLLAIDSWKSSYLPDQTLPEEFCAHVCVRYANLNSAEGMFELGWFRRLFRIYTISMEPAT